VEKVRRSAEIDNKDNNVLNGSEDVKSDLKSAELKIKMLEKQLEELMLVMPKKYGAVKFQNYQNRKRILVSHVNGSTQTKTYT
jgi:hypothetical protein